MPVAGGAARPDDGPMRDSWLDLVLGSACAVCGAAGRVLCPDCTADLPADARPAWPTPCPPGLALPVATGAYDGALKKLVNAHKERQHFALAGPLGRLLAAATTRVLADASAGSGAGGHLRVVLVPVPSRPAVVRSRGHDPVLRMTRVAAAVLRRRGADVGVVRVIRSAAAQDQAGLGVADRAANLDRSMRVRATAVRRLHGRPAVLIVTDDVITTGATAREAQRVLEGARLPVAGVAAVAATRRRLPPRVAEPGGSLPLSGSDD